MQKTVTSNKGLQTRQALIDGAFHLFIEKGYHGTSMRQIAHAADLALGGIYNHFANKEEVFEAVLSTYHPMMRVLPKLAEAEGDTAEELLSHAAHLIVAEIERTPDIINLIFIEVIELKGQHLGALAESIRPNVMTFVQKLIKFTGSLRPYPPPILFRAFLTMISGYIVTDYILARDQVLGKATGTLDDVLEIFLHGLLNT